MTDVMSGVRVLEVAEHTFVPAASAILSDWGADIIKIEHVERGDAMRGLGNTGVIDLGGDVHVLLEHSNRSKRSLGLDLTTDEGLDILYRLAATCDVFLTNKTPGVRAKLKIDVDDIRAHNASIVYVSGTAYGPKGPDADKGGYDMTGYWCRSGSAETVRPADYDNFISQPGPAYGDSLGAMTIAGGISAALFKRERTGEGAVVDVSLLGTGIWALGATVALTAQTGAAWQNPAPGGMARNNPLVGTFTTSDGRFLNITVLQHWKYWPGFCEAIGRPELLEDERYATAAALAENAESAHAIVAEAITSRTLAEAKAALSGWDGQWTPVQNTLDLMTDEQVRANDYIVDLESPTGTAYSLVTTPVQFDGEAARPGKAPDFNEHGDAILTDELGISWDDVIELKVKGVVA